MSVLVSVIMPAYNSERFIEKAILSVVAEQGMDDLELLVVDDWSSDTTWELVSEMQRTYPNIWIMRNVRRKGPAGGRNTGLMNANGKYISFLDSDDVWLPGHLKKSIEYCERDGVDIVFNDFSVVDYETGEHLFNWFERKPLFQAMDRRHVSGCLYVLEGDVVKVLLNESFIHMQALVAKASAFEGMYFDEEMFSVDDLDFCVRLSRRGGHVMACANDVTGIYNRHAGGITAASLDRSICCVENHIKLFESYMRDEDFARYRKTLRKRLVQEYMEHAYWMRKKGRLGDAARSALSAMRYGAGLEPVRELCKVGYSSLQSALSGGR
ncbi:glycosyltransferase family 2 protein [Desulfovibrio psychrotolerans]|uniref:Glycosyl transferase n=1 Tax=Desulfovibrio psychrotolerans TaxID=415242 RepID=A0A7J0BUB2_9BACT|nr:glycosyltransferase [Desulfovibrio psychrotolerans]GFM37307.1 glycosyl transferase [Desulfovibrio psychrotolerans]